MHYENNSPFLTITSMTRVIEVSHWGNIAVEETVDLKHTGAVLKGPFSRYDYQRQPDSGISSVKSFKVDMLHNFSFFCFYRGLPVSYIPRGEKKCDCPLPFLW